MARDQFEPDSVNRRKTLISVNSRLTIKTNTKEFPSEGNLVCYLFRPL